MVTYQQGRCSTSNCSYTHALLSAMPGGLSEEEERLHEPSGVAIHDAMHQAHMLCAQRSDPELTIINPANVL
jgi:hypothetical protein